MSKIEAILRLIDRVNEQLDRIEGLLDQRDAARIADGRPG